MGIFNPLFQKTMIRHFRFTLILFILNVIAFGILFVVSNSQYNRFQKSDRLSSHIIEYTTNLESLRISGAQFETDIRLRKAGRSWMLDTPISWPANNFAVDQIIHQLNLLKETLVFSLDEIKQTNQNLEDYGLANPLLILELFYENKSLEIQIGSTPTIGNKLYLYVPQKESIYVVENSLMTSASFALKDLRQDQIFNIPNFEIRSLNIQKKSNNPNEPETVSVRIARNLDTQTWMFESPLKASADPVLVSQVIEELTSTSVLKFIASDSLDSALLGFENPYMKITLQGNKRRNTLLLGNSIQGAKDLKSYYAKLENSPTIFTVDAAPFDRLLEAQKELREKNFIQLNAKRTSTIDLHDRTQTTRLQKLENNQWQVLDLNENTNTKSIKADTQQIENLIETLASLRATDFFSDNPSQSELETYGFENPLMQITCLDKAIELLTLKVIDHPINKDLLLAKTKTNPTIYSIDRALFDQNFKAIPLYYKNKTLEELPLSATIENLSITDLASNQTLVSFSTLESTELSEDLRKLIANLKRFKVNRYLNEAFSNTLQSENWRYKLAFELLLPGDSEDKLEERIYYFKPRASGNKQIGGSVKHGLTFENNPLFSELLYRFTNEIPYSPESLNQAVESPKKIEAIPDLTVPKAPSDQ